ncbi:MAG: hypothetical protein ABJO27_06000 [Pseudoruegeria sp.]
MITDLEEKLVGFDRVFAPQFPIRLHPNLSELYHRKVSDLEASLGDPDNRSSALEIMRSLFERVTVHLEGEQA